MTTTQDQASPDANKIVIYHAHCCDGQGAAAAFYTKHPEAQFYPGAYSRPLPDVTGRDVYFVDFSCTLPVLKQLLEVANSVTIIDHHKTAIDELLNFKHPKFTAVFDLSHSGAVLTWKWCYPGTPIPKVLTYIEDRDLWRFKFPYTKEVNAYLYSLEFDVEVWAKQLLTDSLFEYSFTVITSAGDALLRQDAKRVKSLIKNSRLLNIGGLQVPAVNCNGFHASDVGHELAKNCFFAATYYDTADGRIFSLRSSHANGADVSAVAKTYGGGGHVTAAGFSVDFATAALMEIK